MADRLWGLNLTNERLPFSQSYGYAGINQGIGNSSSASYAAGSYTMPYAGNLTAAYTVNYSWPQNGHQMAAVHLYNSTPAPATSSYLNHIADNQNSYERGQLPIYAAWSNLVKGQVVSFVIYFLVGGGGPTVTFESWACTVRAWPG